MLPVIRALRERIWSGDLGTPHHLHAELGFRVDAGPEDRMLNPELGASALLDMGIYPLTFAHLMLGQARSLTARADVKAVGESAFDTDVAIVGEYDGGALATMSASITSWSSGTAAIATDRGRIDLADFHHPTHAIWHPAGGEPVRIDPPEPVIGTGLAHEAIEVMRALRAGETTSPVVPPEQTLDLMRQMDAIRAQVGVRYPGE